MHYNHKHYFVIVCILVYGVIYVIDYLFLRKHYYMLYVHSR